MVKRLRKSVQYILRYSTKCASFLAWRSQMSCHLWSCWTEFHEIFTRYRGITYAVNAQIEVAISRFVSECHGDEWVEFAIFLQNWLPWQRTLTPWDIGKRGPDRLSAPKTLSFGEKVAKIVPADPEIIVLRAIVKLEYLAVYGRTSIHGTREARVESRSANHRPSRLGHVGAHDGLWLDGDWASDTFFSVTDRRKRDYRNWVAPCSVREARLKMR